MASEKLEKILEDIASLTLLEVAELADAFEDKFGVTAAAAMPMMAGPMMGGAAEEEVEEKTEFDVILAGVGEQKIKVIKEVRAITDLGLKEAKALVDAAPETVKSGVTKDESEDFKSRLEAVGATVEIK